MENPSGQDACCLRCGYDLTGLGAKGQCPECGQRYDAHSRKGIDDGRAHREAQTQRLVKRLRTGCFGAVALAIAGSAGIIASTTLSDQAWRPLVAGAILAGIFVLAAVTSYVYEK